MYRLALACLLCAGLLTACGYKAGGPDPAAEEMSYRCENGAQLEVNYVLSEEGPSMATLRYRGKLVPMHQEAAASGVLYVADKGHPGYRWHTKGDGGVLSMQSLGDGQQKVLLKNCRAAEKI